MKNNKMTKMVMAQLSIAFHKREFWITLYVMLFYVLYVYIYYVNKLKGNDISNLYSPAIVNALNSDSEYAWFFIRYYQFLVIVPAGFLVYTDRKVRNTSLLISRYGRKVYYYSKVITAFIVNFITFTVPFLIGYILTLCTYPLSAEGTLTGWQPYSDVYTEYANNYLFSDVFFSNKYVYYLLCILLFGVFAGCVGVFIVGISSFNFRFRVLLFLPFYCLIYILEIVSWKMNSTVLNYEFYILAYDSTYGKKSIFIFIYMVILAAIGVSAVEYNQRKEQLW